MLERERHQSWCAKVAVYIERLQEGVEALNRLLMEFRPPDVSADVGRIDDATAKLAASVAEMETMVAERESLLCDDDAPHRGASLAEKLRASVDLESHQLASRCDLISEALADSHHRAVSLFVCQFHLAELSTEIVGILSGASRSATYGPQGTTTEDQGMHARSTGGGGLFNEAG